MITNLLKIDIGQYSFALINKKEVGEKETLVNVKVVLSGIIIRDYFVDFYTSKGIKDMIMDYWVNKKDPAELDIELTNLKEYIEDVYSERKTMGSESEGCSTN
jgi:hypothetical protein